MIFRKIAIQFLRWAGASRRLAHVSHAGSKRVILFSVLAFVPSVLSARSLLLGKRFITRLSTQLLFSRRTHSNASNYSSDSSLQGLTVDAASILVSARNETGDYISQLKAKDFQVLEDGEEQPIVSFREDTVPVNVVF